jgi:hypothetical protein
MRNIVNKNRCARGSQDILDDPQVIELLSKYTEEIRSRRLNPEEFIDNYGYQGPARQEILREMRFAATLERVYANEGQHNFETPQAERTSRAIADITKTVLNKLRTIK